MSTRRTALGRGLSALIPGAPSATDAPVAAPTTLPISVIRAAVAQPRTVFDEARIQGLAASIEANGIIQPIVVRGTGAGDYLIIAGERRYRAAKLLGLHDVPVVIRDVSDGQAYELALIENLQREDLDPIEEASAYQHLIDTYELTQQQVADRVGKDRVTVANALRILKLPHSVRVEVASGRLSAGHARAILSAPEDLRAQLSQDAIEQGWSVRETERQAKLQRAEEVEPAPAVEAPPPPAEAPLAEPEDPPSSATRAVEAQLRAALGAPVRVIERGGRGRVEIRFHSYAELERLIDLVAALEDAR